jgi:hypothetical protein
MFDRLILYSGEEKTILCFYSVTSEHNTDTTHAELPKVDTARRLQTQLMVPVIISTYLMFYTPKLVLFAFIHNQRCKAAWDRIVC